MSDKHDEPLPCRTDRDLLLERAIGYLEGSPVGRFVDEPTRSPRGLAALSLPTSPARH